MNLGAQPQADEEPTHPRFRERLAEVADQSVRSRRRKMWAIAILVGTIVLAAAATQSPLFDIDEVRVVGAQDLPLDEIRQVAAVEMGRPVLGFDTAEIERRLRSIPAVADAAVSAGWDGVATIEVRERMAAARVATPEGVIVIADDRIVIDLIRPEPTIALGTPGQGEPVVTPPVQAVPEVELSPRLEALIAIEGAMFSIDPGQQVPDVLTDAVALASELPADIEVVTEQIEITVDSLELRTIGGATISIGDARDLDAKFAAVRAFLAQVDLSCLNNLNVRAPTVPVLERIEGC